MNRWILGLALAGTLAGGGATADGAEGVRWEPLREPGSGGWITSFAVSPHDGRRCLIGGDMLGIAWSDDRGDSWNPVCGLPMWEICDFTWHPADSNVVWAGSLGGPLRSTDGGRTWTPMREGFPKPDPGRYSESIEKVLFDPNDPARLLAVGGNSREWRNKGAETGLGAVYESRDAGTRWTLLTRIGRDAQPASEGVNLLGAAFAAGSSTRVYAALREGGVAASEDGGRTWAPRNEGLPHLVVARLVAHPTAPDTLWVSLVSGPKAADGKRLAGGVFRSADAGRSWAPVSTGLFDHRAPEGHFTASYKGFAVARSNPDVLAAACGSWHRNGVFLSTDGGANWRYAAGRGNIGFADVPELRGAATLETAYPAGPGFSTLVVDPTDPAVLYGAGSEYAVRSTDGGKTWTDITAHRPPGAAPGAWRGNGYSGLCSSDFVFHPTDPKRAMLLALDAGKVWESRDGLRTWTRQGTDPWPWGGASAGAYSGDFGYALAGQFGDWLGAVVTRDGGGTWTTKLGAAHGLPEKSAKGSAPGGVFADPSDGKRAWAAIGGKLYRTADAGETWTRAPWTNHVAWLAGDPSQPGRFCGIGNRGVFRTADGVAFESLGGPKGATRGRFRCDAAGRIWSAQWRAKDGAGVWRWADGAWTRVLDEYYAHDVAVDPSDSNRIAVATSDDPYHDVCSASGVWISADGGATWSQANDGLAMTRVQCIAFNPHAPEELVCGAWGNGYFRGRWPKSFRPAGARRAEVARSPAAAPAPEGAFAAPLANGGMEDGGATPARWTEKWGKSVAARDTNVFHAGAASLRVTVDGGSGQIGQPCDAAGAAKVRLAGWVRSRGDVRGHVAIQAFSADWSRNSFLSLKYVQGATDWTAFEGEARLPDWAARFNVLLFAEGKGSVWLDDLRNVHAGAAPAVAAAPPAAPAAPAGNEPAPANAATGTVAQIVIRNGGMTQGLRVPAGWNGGVRDTNTFHEGPASLRVDGKASASLRIEGHAGERLRIAGWAKTSGGARAQVAVHSFADGYKQNQWQQLVYLQGEQDWTRFEKEVALPRWTKWSELKLAAEGDGRAWLDEVRDAAGEVDPGKPVSAEDEMRRLPPPKDKPWVEGWCIYDWRSAWFGQHDGFVARSKKGGIDVVVYGDSIAMGWGGRADKLVKSIDPGLTAVNYGIGGDSTRQLLWRIARGEVDGIAPRLAIVAIGTNNLYGDQNGGTDAEIARGIGAVVALLREKLPGTKVLVLSVLPRQNDYFCGRIAKVNAQAAKLADDERVFFHDRTALFQDAPGKIKAPLFNKDQLHLDGPGYKVWDADLRPVLERLLQP